MLPLVQEAIEIADQVEGLPYERRRGELRRLIEEGKEIVVAIARQELERRRENARNSTVVDGPEFRNSVREVVQEVLSQQKPWGLDFKEAVRKVIQEQDMSKIPDGCEMQKRKKDLGQGEKHSEPLVTRRVHEGQEYKCGDSQEGLIQLKGAPEARCISWTDFALAVCHNSAILLDGQAYTEYQTIDGSSFLLGNTEISEFKNKYLTQIRDSRLFVVLDHKGIAHSVSVLGLVDIELR